MNKCPKCNNNLSSSDVLCPKCGALVEEINTNVYTNKPMAEKVTEDSSQTASVPDHYENIILYNETFPMIESEPLVEEEEEEIEAQPQKEEEPEDFDIENILFDKGGTKHVNPLLAHLEKQRNSQQKDYKEAISKDVSEEFTEEVSDEISDFEDDIDKDAVSLDDSEKELYESRKETQDDFDEPTEDYPEESFAEEEEKDIAAPIAINELQMIARELSLPAKEEPSIELSSDSIPAYSKSYLDAIRNEDIHEDEVELEEDFDPKAYMEKFKAEKIIEPEIAPNPTETSEIAIEEEPVRRRYNPNRPKPKYDDIEEPKDTLPPVAGESEEEPAKESEKEPEKESEPQKTEKETELPKPKKKSKKNKAKKKEAKEEDVLELELDPERFFLPEETADEANNEHFVIEREEPKPAPIVTSSSVAYNYDSGDDKSFVAPLGNQYSSEKKRIPKWASLLIWLAVAAIIFFGAYTFDRYVNKNYENYGNYIYEITDGKIDVGGSSSN